MDPLGVPSVVAGAYWQGGPAFASGASLSAEGVLLAAGTEEGASYSLAGRSGVEPCIPQLKITHTARWPLSGSGSGSLGQLMTLKHSLAIHSLRRGRSIRACFLRAGRLPCTYFNLSFFAAELLTRVFQ